MLFNLDQSKILSFSTGSQGVFFHWVEISEEKEENAGISIFSFSQNVFKSFLPKECEKLSSCGTGLTSKAAE